METSQSLVKFSRGWEKEGLGSYYFVGKFLLLVSISPLPTSWIIFMIMTLNSFIGKLPIYTAGAFILFLCLEHVPRPPHSVYVVICTFMYVVG